MLVYPVIITVTPKPRLQLCHPNQRYNPVTQTKATTLLPKPTLQLCHPNWPRLQLCHPNQGYNSVTQTKPTFLLPRPRLQLPKPRLQLLPKPRPQLCHTNQGYNCYPNQGHNSVTQTKPWSQALPSSIKAVHANPHANGTKDKIGLRFNGNFTNSHCVRLCAPYKLICHKILPLLMIAGG